MDLLRALDDGVDNLIHSKLAFLSEPQHTEDSNVETSYKRKREDHLPAPELGPQGRDSINNSELIVLTGNLSPDRDPEPYHHNLFEDTRADQYPGEPKKGEDGSNQQPDPTPEPHMTAQELVSPLSREVEETRVTRPARNSKLAL